MIQVHVIMSVVHSVLFRAAASDGESTERPLSPYAITSLSLLQFDWLYPVFSSLEHEMYSNIPDHL